ncbi:MAG: hypothetical protein PHE20_03125 [Patescibacteria group bacterium]|nr:hypothetical protein [Patescibacteria group bacterium]
MNNSNKKHWGYGKISLIFLLLGAIKINILPVMGVIWDLFFDILITMGLISGILWIIEKIKKAKMKK